MTNRLFFKCVAFFYCILTAFSLIANDWFAVVDTYEPGAAHLINLSTDEIVTTIGGNIANPSFIAANSDGSYIYYTNQSANSVGIINRATNTIIGTIPVGLTPLDIAIFGSRAYVTNFSSASISVIDINTNTVVDTIPVLTNPCGIAITPDGTTAYVVYSIGTTASAVDLATHALTSITGLPSQMIEVIVNPGGTQAYVTALTGGDPAGSGIITVIDVETNTVTTTFLSGGRGARGIDITNDGLTAYVANSTSNTVAVINLSTNLVVATIPVGTGPYDVVLSPDNTQAYAISNTSNSISVINTATNQVSATILVQGINPRSMAITPDGLLGYVVDITSDSIETVDLQSNLITNNLQNPFNYPSQLAINPTGTIAYIPNNKSGSTLGITLVDIATRQVLGFMREPNLAALLPAVVAITPDGTKAYVTNQSSTPPNSGQVTVFDLGTQTAITTIPVGVLPYGIALSPDGSKAYVANVGSGAAPGSTLTMIDTATNQVTGTISGFSLPNFIAITPDGTKAYVTSYFNNSSVYVVDLATNTISTTISVGLSPEGVAITPDGTRAYVANFGDSTVSIIDTSTNQVLGTLTVGASPANLSVTPDGKKVYVAVHGTTSIPGNQVVVIDTETNAIIDTIVTTIFPFGIAITPDQAPVAEFTVGKGIAGRSTIFDASTSFSPVGTIVSYQWDFGDGSILLTSDPMTTHTYTGPGNYTVTLTVTNSAGTSTTQIFTGQTLSRNGGPSATATQAVSIAPLVLPPTHLQGKQTCKKFCRHCKRVIEFSNILTWNPPVTGPRPTHYRISRTPAFKQPIVTIPGGQFKFKDRDVKKGVTYMYFMTSVDVAGNESDWTNVTVEPKKKRACLCR